MSVSVVMETDFSSKNSWWRRVRAAVRRGLRNLDAQCDAYQSVMFPEPSERAERVNRK